MKYPKQFLQYLQNNGQAVYVIHTVFPYGDGNGILGFVLSIEEFDAYAQKVHHVTSTTHTQTDYYGTGSKHYTINGRRVDESFDLICEPLKHLAVRTEPIWHNGIHLTPEQYTVIYASPFGGSTRMMYNRLAKRFVNVGLVNINDEEYLCFKTDMDDAKDAAKKQDLDVKSVEYCKIG